MGWLNYKFISQLMVQWVILCKYYFIILFHQFYSYAEKDGYHTSCRGITFQNKAAVTAHGSVDLGLGKRLKRG